IDIQVIARAPVSRTQCRIQRISVVLRNLQREQRASRRRGSFRVTPVTVRIPIRDTEIVLQTDRTCVQRDRQHPRRVLQYPAASLTSGATDPAAALVIGQAGLTVANGPATILDRNTLAVPAGLAFDSAGHLFVSDSGANRLLVYTPPFSNGMAASRLAGIVNPAPSGA